MMEKTLIVVKPDGLQRKLTGRIISRFEEVGLKIVGMKMVWISRAFAKKHYSAHVKKHFYRGLEDFITIGPVVALVLEGINAVELARKLTGSTEPALAAPGTIRGDFSHHSYEHSDKKGVAIKNILHASGSAADAKKEIALWFSKKELHSYRTVDEEHVF